MLKKLFYIPLLLFALLMTSCDEDTASVGWSTIPDYDYLYTHTGTYPVVTQTVEAGPVLANTSKCYLGSVVDPETSATTTCGFLAQYHLRENFALPRKELMYKNDAGELEADSCFLVLYFKSFYGDSLNTMKVHVQELDRLHIMEENVSYYTTLDPSDYLSSSPAVDIMQTYTVRDLTKTASTSSTTYRTVQIRIPTEYATNLIKAYFDSPSFYRNSYSFIHNLCPGFYFESAGGIGNMLNVELSSLDIYFRYHSTTTAGNDTILNGFERMAATEEVIQTNVSSSSIPAEMLDATNEYSYVKTPAGLFTEVTIPVGDIVAGGDIADSINQVRMSIGRYHDTSGSTYTLAPPPNLLLLPKASLQSFFETGQSADGVSSFVTEYSSSTNSYTFSNIAPYVSALRHLRDDGAGVLPTDTDYERYSKYAAWEAANPEWNKMLLVPVAVDYTQSTSSTTTTTTKTVLRVRNELGLYSAKLQGGPSGNELYLEVVYSKFSF